MSKRSKLSTAQKQEVVLQMLRREEPAATLARRYGVSEQSLYRWRDEFLEGAEGERHARETAGGGLRFVDDPDTIDCQHAPGTCGEGPVVDLGVYEFQACMADLDGDEQVSPAEKGCLS